MLASYMQEHYTACWFFLISLLKQMDHEVKTEGRAKVREIERAQERERAEELVGSEQALEQESVEKKGARVKKTGGEDWIFFNNREKFWVQY